jgi:hypothetical protein
VRYPCDDLRGVGNFVGLVEQRSVIQPVRAVSISVRGSHRYFS